MTYLVKMNKKYPNISYIIAVCKSQENNLIGKDRIFRMAESSSLKDALSVLHETSFGASENGDFGLNFDELIRAEEKNTAEFIREYSPTGDCLNFCLLPYDFYNAEVLVKCAFTKYAVEKYLGIEGVFKIDFLQQEVDKIYGECFAEKHPEERKSEKFKRDNGTEKEEPIVLPEQLKNAIKQSVLALKNGEGGLSVSVIFSRAKYACLLSCAKHAYLKDILVKEIDALNLSVILRSENQAIAESMFIDGGTLTKAQKEALYSKDKKAAQDCFVDGEFKNQVMRALDDITGGQPLVELERYKNSLGAGRMIDGRFVEQTGTMPFMLYVLKRKNEIACVRTVLTAKANGRTPDDIKKRLLRV